MIQAPVVCYTSASFAYLDRVRVLGETIKKHHPEWEFVLLLSDEEPEGYTFKIEEEPIDRLVRIGDLGIPNLRRWIFEHDVVELCTAVKGPMMLQLLEAGVQKVVYLDPDIALFNSMNDVLTLLNHYDVILTPHQLEPDHDRQAILDNEIGSLKYGIYNLGFVAVANSEEGLRFAKWWNDRLLAFCFDDVPNGLFTDQRWCDHAPAFFPTLFILRDPGYNVASWNLSQRPLTIERDGSILVAGRPLRFFHFTKITGPGEVMITRYARGNAAVFEVMKWYKETLAACATNVPSGWWAYGTYGDGAPIPREHRVAYRKNARLIARFPDPFAAGDGSLSSHLRKKESKQSK